MSCPPPEELDGGAPWYRVCIADLCAGTKSGWWCPEDSVSLPGSSKSNFSLLLFAANLFFPLLNLGPIGACATICGPLCPLVLSLAPGQRSSLTDDLPASAPVPAWETSCVP